MQKLEKTFHDLIERYSDDKNLNNLLWQEIEANYSSDKKYYHNLGHIQNMVLELEKVKDKIGDYDILLFSVFYHDVIYSSGSKSNEEKSAQFAKERMRKINFCPTKIRSMEAQILATKKHQRNADPDINFLLDADLCILGKDWDTYQEYSQQIRKEYKNYPNNLYKPGRKKVLKHFLDADEIFKTLFFKNKYEHQARFNLLKEIEYL